MNCLPMRLACWTLPLLIFALFFPAPAPAEEMPDGATMDEIINVLKRAKLIDETEAERMRVKAAGERSKRNELPDVASKLFDRMKFNADFRLRQENLWFSRDPLGSARDDRSRQRYRLRLGMELKANDWADVVVRLTSGNAVEIRSANQSIGSGNDYDPDAIFIDRAYLRARLPEVGPVKSIFQAGKMDNPFRWKKGKDFMIWDGDINPEGIALRSHIDLSEDTRLFGNFAWFTADEQATSADPKVIAYQVGTTTRITDGVKAGLRGSFYDWRSINNAMITRNVGTVGPPALPGLGNQTNAFDGTNAQIVELSTYLDFSIGDCPVLLWGQVARNLQADSMIVFDPGTLAPGPDFGEENDAFGVGFEFGSSKQFAKFGVSYFEVEANAVIARFIDSDLFDGWTNRRGWVFYGSKKVSKAVELKATLFASEPLGRDFLASGAPFDSSLSDSRRLRSQLDFIVKY